jgi:hypothetical protein
MSVTEVQGYQTSDGRVFADRAEAEREEATVVLTRVLKGAPVNGQGPLGPAILNPLITHLLDHAVALVEVLRPLADNAVTERAAANATFENVL